MSVLEKVIQAWSDLSEKEKKIFCKSVIRNKPSRFKEWYKFAGLTSGFRSQTIAKREIGTHLLDKLDKALFELRDGDFARFRLKDFFCEFCPELNNKFIELVTGEKASISRDMEQLVNKFRDMNIDNPFIELFCASAEWMKSDWDDEITEIDLDEDDASNNDYENKLEHDFNQLLLLPDEVKVYIEKLSNGVKTDVDSLYKILQKADEAGDLLRCKTFEAAESVGISSTEWQNRDEFKELIDSIREKRIELIKSKDISEFYRNLDDLLATCKIIHKSQATRSKLEIIKDQACSQLRAVVDSGSNFELPRCRDLSAIEWFEWSLTLAGSALEELIDVLESSLSSLGQLICEVERHHFEFVSQVPTENTSDLEEDTESCTNNNDTDVMEKHTEPVCLSDDDPEHTVLNSTLDNDTTVEEQKYNQPPVGGTDSDISNIESKKSNVLIDNTIDDKEDSIISDQNTEDNSSEVVNTRIDTISKNNEEEKDNRQELAITDNHDYFDKSNIEALFSNLIDERNLEWAYWLSVALGNNSSLPSWLMEICELGIQFQPIFKASEDQLRRVFADANISEQLDDLNEDAALILGASLIRPLLMAPYTYPLFFMEAAASKLHRLPHFNKLSEELCNFAKKGLSLGEELIQGLTSIGHWEAEKIRLEKITNEWLDVAPKRTIVYPKATRVWEKWVTPNGELRTLVDNCCSNSLSREEMIFSLDEWKDEYSFDRKMDLTNKELTKGPQPEPIRFGARDRLRRHVDEVIEIAEGWMNYHFRKTKIGNERYGLKELQQLAPVARKVADALTEISNNGSALTVAGCRLMANVMEELYSLYSISVVTLVVDPIIARETELLFLPTITKRDGELYGDQEFQEAVMNHLGRPLDLEDSFKRHLEHGHFALAARIVAMLSESTQNLCRETIEENRKKWNKRIELKIKELSVELMGMLLKGAITETDQDKWNNELERLEKNYKEFSDEPFKILASIERINKDVLDSASDRALLARKQMDQLISKRAEQGQPLSTDILNRFDIAIQHFDLSVANDILTRVEDTSVPAIFSEIVVDKPENNSFVAYMGEVNRLFDFCADFRTACKSLRNHSRWDLFPDHSAFDDTHSRNIADALSWWNSIQDRSNPRSRFDKTQPADLFKLLRWLGFQIPAEVKLEEAEKSHGSPNFWQHYKVKGNIDSPIPLFGTQAHQVHHLVMVWGNLDSLDFARWLKGSDKIRTEDSITIIYFNRIDCISRRKAIHSLRKAGFTPLLVDACLMAWLCQFSGAERTTEFFNICLPGGRTNPYTPEVAGSVPKEMYFGRKRDIEQLWKDDGPCIIYGGRQLGKSALLQQVKRRYHDPANENYVIYHGKFATELMDIIRRLLVNEGLLVDNRLNDDDKIKAAILKLLNDKPSCRIRILLDECDHLIEEDSKQRFRQLSLVRDLMTESNRRFKVVLAGLHSVQRFQRIPNQPLAHFGSPLCIGPLQPKDAERLVIYPLQSLGFKFDPPYLVQRVLAYTNFHPSLIQLFCHDLVEAMHESQRVVIDNTPPFTIDEKTINHVFKKSSLAKKMRDRFDWTLDLDKRYRVIGYAIAFLEMVGDIPSEGLRIMEVLSQVKSFWPNGFHDTNIDEMTGLMLEMEGLGLLTRTSSNGYRLKSHNVLSLLGSEKEISDELKRFENEIFVHPADPQVIRRMINYSSGKTSPLTIFQENSLLQRTTGIDLVIGTEAHEIMTIPAALTQIIEDRASSHENEPEFKVIDNVAPSVSLVTALKNIYSTKKANLSYRVIVYRGKYNAAEYASHILAAKKWVEGLRLEVKYFKIQAVLDPETLLEMHLSGCMENFRSAGTVAIHSLRRWHVSGIDHWFHDVGRLPSKEIIGDWFDKTGGWPCLVQFKQNQLLNHADICPEELAMSKILLENLRISELPIVSEVAKFMGEYVEPLSKADIMELFADKYKPNEIAAAMNTLLDLDAAIGSHENMQLEKRLCSTIHIGD